MKDIYETPEVDIVKFTIGDIITTSGPGPGPNPEIDEDEFVDPFG